MKTENKILKKHYDYYKNVGVETIKQQAGQVEQVSKDYEGRVIFELLQNAFDKAKKNILVEVQEDSLYIANDGTKFTYNANHDYKEGQSDTDKFTRYDFQSLCSISTSSKNTSESIGNKGVGFKSVFSVAKDGYVNVYTKGEMIENGNGIPKTISFGIFDSFKNVKDIPGTFPEDLQNCIEKQIQQVQQERKERGVPGYYYPLHINEEPQIILDYFKQGYVTVVEIPFQNLDIIKDLFEEIRNIHFNFVSLKYPEDFNIEFKLNGESFKKIINTETGLFFSTIIKDEAIENIAKEADIHIGSNNKVAICFKSEEEIERGETGLLYNYLPTQKASPFKYVDFHADFHTSVDRKAIEFSKKSKIGQYNTALLRACVELYVSVIYSCSNSTDKADIQIKYLEEQKVNLYSFRWHYLAVNSNEDVYDIVRSILKIEDDYINQWNWDDNNRYKVAVDLISGIANTFFRDNAANEKDRNDFFKYVIEFIYWFTDDYKKQYSRVNIFKNELADKLLSLKIQLLPNIILDHDIEVLYKEKDNEELTLPTFMGVNVTTFRVPDEYFSSCLGIKKYSDINVLFKYFRQTSIKGEISESSITETDQISLLRSLFQLYKTKTDKPDSFAHRYSRFLSESDRKYNSAQNITAFSVSTVFLKTITGKYKPAQLCSINELDSTFLESFIDNEELRESFLIFVGVSTESGYLIIDKKIFNALKDGLDYIPATYSRDETENLTAKEIIPNIVVLLGKKEVHPALINYNRYPFLEDVSNKKIQKHLYPLRIGDYDSFPSEYADILIKKMKENTKKYPQDVFRLYSANTFRLFYERGVFLTINKGKLFWTSERNFKIAQNRNDFELLKNQDLILLCFFNGNEIPESIKHYFIELSIKAVEINNEKIITDEFRESYESLIPFVLAEISYLNLSEKDYIKNIVKIKEFQSYWNSISVISGDKLSILVEYQKDSEPLKLPQTYCFHAKKLYFDNSISTSQKSEAIAKSIFNIGSLSAKVELIFFHKKPEDIKIEYNQEDINEIIKMWLPDYYKKFEAFQKNILGHFSHQYSEKDLWYVYNDSHKSELLINLDKENRLNELIQFVNDSKGNEEYLEYFDGFKIEIDRSHIESKAGEILALNEELDGDKAIEMEVKKLSKRLGSEARLNSIFNELQEKNPESQNKNIAPQKSEKHKEIELNNRIDDILNKIAANNISKEVQTLDLSGESISQPLPTKKKQIVYKGEHLPNSKMLETIGASGEEEVLLFFINEFITDDTINRVDAINQVYGLLKEKIGDDSLKKFKDICIKVADDNEKLKRALIPLFYATMHHKFSFFDLIVFYENQPTLVEVKTTSNNKTFYLSVAEVEAARGKHNYIIVRNTSDCIYILGNPIKSVERELTYIKGDKFTLKARNYELKLTENK
jgi:hypothetical protein